MLKLSKVDFVRMTGSGSAFVAYYRSKEKSEKAKYAADKCSSIEEKEQYEKLSLRITKEMICYINSASRIWVCVPSSPYIIILFNDSKINPCLL